MEENVNGQDKTETPYPDEEVNLLDYFRVIWKRKFLIAALISVTVLTTAVLSLRMVNIYQASAVISPVTGKEAGGGLSAIAQQFGGLPGISLPGSASSSSEIVNLVKSSVLRERVIEKHDLLPVLFYEKWDDEKKIWKTENKKGVFGLNWSGWIERLVKAVQTENNKRSGAGFKSENNDTPTIWDGLRALDGVVKVTSNIKDNTITISAELYDPEIAAKMPEYFLTALNEHLVNEAKRVAETNKKYLEEQLVKTADPLIRQKIYSLIAQQIESSMMAEVKENFAFKVIDQPRVPDKKIKPKRTQMIILSFTASLFAGIFLAFLIEAIENTKRRNGVRSTKTIKEEATE